MTAREAALRVLTRCRRDGAWSGQILDQTLSQAELSPKDAALVSQLSLGVMQNSRYLDFAISRFCDLDRLEPKLRDLLRLGAYQLLLLDRIPPHAAVNESVSLCRTAGMSRAAGLVNAVLRRLAQQRDCLPEPPGAGSAAYLAVRYSVPDFFVEKLLARYDYDFCEAFLRACLKTPETDLQLNTLKTDLPAFRALMEEKKLPLAQHDFPSHCVSVSGGRVSELPGFGEGLFYVQDRAAAMAVEIAAPQRGMRVLDACAAPGGKSFAAALRMQNEGSVLSCDIHEKKLALIREGANRLGLSCIETCARDARAPEESWRERFDLVIADVPCSGFGVLRKKPEIRSRRAEETEGLPEIQLAILNNVSRFVKPGGTLLYSTCTVLFEENDELVARFLRENPAFSPEDCHVGDRSSHRGCYTFWPHLDGTDGFFAAKLIRK